MKITFNIGKYVILLTILTFLSCNNENSDYLESENIEISNINRQLEGGSNTPIEPSLTDDPILSDYQITTFQVTYASSLTKFQRNTLRNKFYNDSFTTLISYEECSEDKDVEIWYVEVHYEFAPGYCPPGVSCGGGPKKPTSHIEDNGSDLDKRPFTLSVKQDIGCPTSK